MQVNTLAAPASASLAVQWEQVEKSELLKSWAVCTGALVAAQNSGNLPHGTGTYFGVAGARPTEW